VHKGIIPFENGGGRYWAVDFKKVMVVSLPDAAPTLSSLHFLLPF